LLGRRLTVVEQRAKVVTDLVTSRDFQRGFLQKENEWLDCEDLFSEFSPNFFDELTCYLDSPQDKHPWQEDLELATNLPKEPSHSDWIF